MKQKILILLLLTTGIGLYAQDISQLRITGKAEQLLNEIINKEVRDKNGELCAGLVILSDLTGLNYQSSLGIVKNNQSSGKDFLFLSPSERMVEVFCSGYEPLKIILNEIGIKLKSGEVWQIKVTGEKKLNLIPINIIANPEGANITIDGINKGMGITYQVTEGEHEIKIEKEGYRTLTKKINVNTNNVLFTYPLERIEPVLIHVKTTPSEAKIYIDNFEKGITDKDFHLFPGKYKIKISKSGFVDQEKEIVVEENMPNSYSFTLSKTSVTLSLKVTPSDAKVLINKEDYSNRASVELSPGRYLIEISKEGYSILEETIVMVLEKPLVKEYLLKRKTGKLQITVQPTDARVELKNGAEIINQWSGSKYIKDIGIGKYTLITIKEGYQTNTKQISIMENQTTSEDITLEKIEAPVIQKQVEKNQTNYEGMVYVEGGEFMMGSESGDDDEKPVHKVVVKSFYIDKYEVTVAEFEKFVNATNYKTNAEKEGWSYIWNGSSWVKKNGVYWLCGIDGKLITESKKNYPVIHVSWYDANAYALWAGKRLPTEAEWEYAARGGKNSRGYRYSGSDNIKDVAWYCEEHGIVTIHEVGAKQPNELGIYDMSGNVWEWCHDWYSENYYYNSMYENPQGPVSGIYRVLRGGAWSCLEPYNSVYIRSYMMNLNIPTYRDIWVGFRCAKDAN
jgi:formylglycine-generating enzyme required for sulfatase activity